MTSGVDTRIVGAKAAEGEVWLKRMGEAGLAGTFECCPRMGR